MNEASLEHFSAVPKTENWPNYIAEMGRCMEENEPSALEELLLEPHPLLPGEREAYLWLVESLDRPLRVQLDKDDYHVIPIANE